MYEERHHLVADQLVDDRVVSQQRLRRGGVEAVEQGRKVGGDGLLAESG
jgi:hypothetical protein